ncbi:MAG: hypothetical protein AAB784_00130 [Patescibacteria group bacterium]
MPCNIGYKTYAPIRIPQPTPQRFKKKMPSPSIDQDLLEKLGVNDQVFLSWIQKLNIKPLLEEALKKTLELQPSESINFSISEDGNIIAESFYTNSSEKNEAEKTTNRVINHWQMEVLKIVTRLLGYKANILNPGENSTKALTLVAEEEGKSHPCKYIRISKNPDSNGEIVFEHFTSKSELEKEKIKFIALAQRLGVKIALPDSPVNGQPIPGSVEEHTGHSHTHNHSHHHGHNEIG